MFVRKTTFRFGLCVTCCLSITVPALAQNTFDPFAPNAVAPTEPMAAPTAPTPLAPKLPPRPMPRPVPVIEAAPAPVAQTPTPVTAEPIISKPMMTEPVTPVTAQAPAPNTDPSFWDKLNSIFDDKDKPQENPKLEVKKTAPPEPVKEIEKPIQPEPTPKEPVAVETPAPTSVPYVAQAPAPYAVSADPQSTNPFAASSVAPSTPTEAPRAIIQPTIVKQVVAPEPILEPVLSAQPMTVVNDTPLVEKTSPVIEQVATPETSNEPSFFDKLSNIFSSPKSTETLKEEPKVETVQEPEHAVDVVEEIKTIEAVVKPVQAPTIETVKSEPEGPGLFDRITNFFDNALTPDEPTEKNIQTIVEEKQPVEEKTTEQAAPEKEVKPAPIPKPLDPRLLKAELGLGKFIKLGQGDDELSKKAKCFTKNRGTVAFCLNPTIWPNTIVRHFDVSSHLYKGTQGIVQLDGNIATRLFTLFNKDGFEDLVKYYENKLGPATAHFVRKTRTIRRGTIDNPVYVWRKENIDEGLVEIMELRKIADMRGSLPDLEHGTMRVYFEGAREIFARTSELDFMDLR